MSDVKISTFSPYNDNSVGSFHFSGGTLNAVLTDGITAIGTDSYTLEMWVYHTSITGQQTYASDTHGNTNGVYFYKNSSHQLSTYYTSDIATSSITIGANRWYHVAVVRNGSALKQYINGAEAGTATDNTNLTDTAFSIGDSAETTSAEMIGFISDVRLVVGNSSAAIYTSAFTPPTTALTNVSGTGYSTYVLMQPGKNSNLNRDTAASEERHFATFHFGQGGIGGVDNTTQKFSNDGLTVLGDNGNNHLRADSNFKIPSSHGKYYVEVLTFKGGLNCDVGIIAANGAHSTTIARPYSISTGTIIIEGLGRLYENNSSKNDHASAPNWQAAGSTSSPTLIALCIDMDNDTIHWIQDNVQYQKYGSGPALTRDGTAVTTSGLYNYTTTNIINDHTFWKVTVGTYSDTDQAHINFGQDPTFQGVKSPSGGTTGTVSGSYADENGVGSFFYQPPDGYLAISEFRPTRASGLNKAAINPDNYFDALEYQGIEQAQRVRGLKFKPDFVWIKAKDYAQDHIVFDSVRGMGKNWHPNNGNAEAYNNNSLTSFEDDGFSLGTSGEISYPNKNYIAWCWKAGGDPVVNTDGTVAAMVSANKEAGFSIITYTGVGPGTAANEITLGHGLDNAPQIVIVKKRTGTSQDALFYHDLVDGSFDYGVLAATDASGNSGNTLPNSKIIHGGGSVWNINNVEHIIYAWHSVEGYSKFGTYEGSGNADGPFVYLGFKPAWLMIKNADVGSAGYSWYMWDGKRPGYNINHELFANDTQTQNTGFDRADFLSNGFKIRNTGAAINGSGSTMLYMAFAETPSAFTNGE